MDFLSRQSLMYTSKKFEDIYIHLNKTYNIKYHELFVLLCSIGFKQNRRSKIEERGREFRGTFFNESQRVVLYTILLELNNMNMEDLTVKDNFSEYQTLLEEYAEGGMEILLEEALPPGIHENTGAKIYNNYIVDIMAYVYRESLEAPF